MACGKRRILYVGMSWYLSCLGHVASWWVSICVFDQSWQLHMTHFDFVIIPVLQLLSKGCERLSERALAFLNTLFAIAGHMVRLLAHPECQSPQAGIFWVLVPGYTHSIAKHYEFWKIFPADSLQQLGNWNWYWYIPFCVVAYISDISNWCLTFTFICKPLTPLWNTLV